MTANSIRRTVVACAMLATLVIAVEANAFCCGGGATTAYYPGSYNAYYGGSYSAYYPGAYQTYYSGWYPGYYWDRIRARLWGSPSTYVAAYPSTYYSGYAPTYTAAYQPAYAGYATSYAAPSGCSSCSTHTAGYSPCSTCAPVQQVTLRPACTTAYSPACSTGNCSSCSGCTTCGTVSQTSYQQSTGCSSCGVGAPVQGQTTVIEQSRSPMSSSPQTFDESRNNGAPTIEPDADVPMQREGQKPPTNGSSQEIQPVPGEDTNTEDPYGTSNGDSGAYFQAPKLFDPNDRAAQRRSPRRPPVTTALYQKPVSYLSVSTRPITAQQAQQDAAGWTSVSN